MNHLLFHLRKLFPHPAFTDEETSQQFNLLNTILWGTVISILVYLVVSFFISPVSHPIQMLLVFGALLLSLSLQIPLRRGYVQSTSWVFVAGLWVIATLGAMAGGGVVSPGFAAYVVVVLIAGLLLSTTITAVLTSLCVLMGGILLYMDFHHLLPEALVTPQRIWVGYTVVFIFTAVLVRLALRNMFTALKNYKCELQERKTAEKQLRQSEQRYRSLFEHNPQPVWVFNRHTLDFLAANEAAIHHYGYTQDEFLTMNAKDLRPPEDVPALLQAIAQVQADYEVVSGRWRHIKKDGSLIEVEVSVYAIELDGQEAIISLINDMTERHRQEALMNGQKTILEMIARGAPLPSTLHHLLTTLESQDSEMYCSILLLDKDGLRLNHGAAPRLPVGYTQAIDGVMIGPSVGSCGTAAFTGQPVIVTDIATDPLWANYREIALQHQLQACWSTPIFDSLHQVVGTFAIYYQHPRSPTPHHLQLIQMVTHTAAIAIERNRVEEELRYNELRFSRMILAAWDGIIIADNELRVVVFNPAAEKLFGYSAKEVLGQSVSRFIPESYREIHNRHVQQFNETAVPNRAMGQTRLIKGLNSKGEEVPIEASVSKLDVMGQFHYAVILHDVRERLKAETALRESESRYRAFTQAIPDLMFLLDRAGTYQDFHAPYKGILVNPPEEIIGQTLWELLPPNVAAKIEQRLQAVFSGSALEVLEYELTVPDGNKLFDARIVPVNQELAMMIVRDITERKQREQELEMVTAVSAALRTAETRDQMLPVIVEQVSTLLGVKSVALALKVSTTHEVAIVEARGGFARAVGTILNPGEGITGMVIASGQMFMTNHVETETRFARSELVDPHQAEIILPLIAKEECIGALLVGYDQEIKPIAVRLLTAISNIAASAIHRAALHETTQAQARQLTRIMESVPDGIILLSGKNQIVAANPGAMSYLMLLTDIPADNRLTRLGDKPIELLLQRPFPGTIAREVTINSPASYTFEVFAYPINAESQHEGWVLILRDVTEARKLQTQSQQQERLAAVGQLAAGIAHDFNNIMSVIVLYSQLLQHTAQLSPPNAERVKTIFEQAEHASRLIEQILDFSRRSVMARSPIDLLPFVKEMVKLWRRTLPESIHLELENDQESYVVYADPTRLQQVLMNLTVNARDAMPTGGILRLSLHRLVLQPGENPPVAQMSPGSWLVLGISDTGSGIQPELLPRIFEPFFTTKMPGQGTGLGLAQVYGIVKQHDGHITVTSQPGVSTEFRLYLPLVGSTEAPLPFAESSVLDCLDRSTKILIVENEAVVGHAMKEALELTGYHVVMTENGRLALELFMSQPETIDLVISDMIMPEMGGLELYLAMQTISPHVKMILMSGYPLEDGGRTLLEKGVVAWLQKPFSLNVLLKKIEEVIK